MLVSAAYADISMNIRVDRTNIYLGESFNLYAEVSGADAGLQPPDLSALDADVQLRGSNSRSQRSIQIINGRMTQEIFEGRVFVFAVKPRQAGQMVTGPIILTHKGRSYRGQGQNVNVAGIEQQDIVVAKISASGETLLVEEPFTVTISVLIAALPEPYAQVEPISVESPPHLHADFLSNSDIAGLDGPDLNNILQGLVAQNRRAPSFYINEYQSNQMSFFMDPFDFADRKGPPLIRFRLNSKRLTNNGKQFWQYDLMLDYTARQEGDYTFGPLTFKGPVITGADNQRRAITKDFFTVGPAVTVRVVPPPEEDRPEWFVGSVGRDMQIRTALDTDVCKVGDPLWLTLELTGNISLANLKPPLLSLQPGVTDDFRVYDDNIASSSLSNGKQFRYRVRPLRAGTLEFPAIKAAYYDVGDKQYRTVTSKPLPIQARPTAQVVVPVDNNNGTNVAVLVSDNYKSTISTSGITVGEQALVSDQLLPSGTLIVFVLILAPAGYLLVLFVRWGWERRAILAVRHRAARAGANALKKLHHNSNLSAAQMLSVLRNYLSARLHHPAHACTPAEAESLLIQSGASRETASECGAILKQLEEALYRPDADIDVDGINMATIVWIKRCEKDIATRK